MVRANGIDVHIAEAGYYAVAPDLRGYGETDAMRTDRLDRDRIQRVSGG